MEVVQLLPIQEVSATVSFRRLGVLRTERWTRQLPGRLPLCNASSDRHPMAYPTSAHTQSGAYCMTRGGVGRKGGVGVLQASLFASVQARVKGVRRSTNAVLHGWLKEELSAILATLPPPSEEMTQISSEANLLVWESWREGLSVV